MKIRKILENTPNELSDDEIQKIISDYPGAKLRRDGRIDLTYAINISKSPEFIQFYPGLGRRLTVKFGKSKGFFMNSLNMSSMIGSPEIVDGEYSVRQNLISDLEGIPRIMNHRCNLSLNPNLKSLKGIGKLVTRLDGELVIPSSIKSNILGVFMIDDIHRLTIQQGSIPVPLFKSVNIVNNHLDGNKDVLECQEELISAGYKEFAKL